MREPFVTLIFRGARYGEAAMPVEALPELAAYQDLLQSAARDLWLRENPGRQRTPKGFDKGFRLAMTGVSKGSTVPQVERLPTAQSARFGKASRRQVTLFELEPDPDVFDRARDLVEETIAQVFKGEPALKFGLSKETLAKFNAFGKSLRDDDEIVVAKPNRQEGAVYNRAVRKTLVLAAQETYEEEIELRGRLRRIDLDQNSFGLRTPDGDTVPVTFSPLFMQIALTSITEGVDVRVRGLGIYNAKGELTRVAGADEVALAADEDEDDDDASFSACRISVVDQIASLQALEDGWLEGDEATRAYDPTALAWAQALLETMLKTFELRTPFIYPTPDGEVRAEWPGRGWNVVVLIEPTTRKATAFAISAKDDVAEELEFSLPEPGAEMRLGKFVAAHTQEGVGG